MSTAGGFSGNTGGSGNNAWLGSTVLGGAGVDGVAGAGGYGGNSGTIDGGVYNSIAKYSTFYIVPVQNVAAPNSPTTGIFWSNVLKSTNGTTWSLVNTNVKIQNVFTGVDGNLYGTAYPTSFVQARASTGGNSLSMDFYTSTDGATWTYFSTVTGATFIPTTPPLIVNGYYVYTVGFNTVNYIYSTDLITWNTATFNTAPNGVDSFGQMCYSPTNAEYYAKAAGSTATTNLQYATNIAGPWTIRTTNIAGGIQTIVANTGSRLVAQFTSPSPYMHYSDDGGVTWTPGTGTLTGITANAVTLMYLNSTYLATYQSIIFYSADGAAWITATDGTTSTYGKAIYGDSAYRVLGTGATSLVVLYAATPSGAWTSSTFTTAIAGGVGGNGGYPGGGGGAGGVGDLGAKGGNGGGGMVRVTSW